MRLASSPADPGLTTFQGEAASDEGQREGFQALPLSRMAGPGAAPGQHEADLEGGLSPKGRESTPSRNTAVLPRSAQPGALNDPAAAFRL